MLYLIMFLNVFLIQGQCWRPASCTAMWELPMVDAASQPHVVWTGIRQVIVIVEMSSV